MSKTRKAVGRLREAAYQDIIADGMEGGGRVSRRLQAESLRNQASALLTTESVPAVVAGEVVGEGTRFVDTLANPDTPAIEASLGRADLLLLNSRDITGMALDAATSVKAGNSLEKMLAHQMALAHASAFTLMDRALGQKDSVETARLTNASCRLMDTYQRALLTLQRLRTGGAQTVTVQHVHVGEGGQAVIGNVQTGGSLPPGEVIEK